MRFSNRCGKFILSSKLWHKNPDLASNIFTHLQFIPLQVEYDYTRGTTYYGVSHLFDELNEGEVIPEYVITINNDEIKVERNGKDK